MLRRSALPVAVLIAGLLGLSAALSETASAQARRGPPLPKTIVLGFDGMDHALAQQFMDAGDLPNFKRLAERGVFQRLETSNPAQSPVSWAVFNTGCNPGKTGVPSFVSRVFPRDANDQLLPYGTPMPNMMLGLPDKIPADDFVRFPMAMHQPGLFRGLAAGGGLLIGLLLLKVVLHLPLLVALLGSALLAAGGAKLASDYAAQLPADGKVPYTVNPMQGTNFWTRLDQHGVRFRGIAMAQTFPADSEGEHTSLLSGLGVFDVTGSPGSWTIYTTDQWQFVDKSTGSGGRIVKVFEDTPGMLRADLGGPRNWFQTAVHEERLRKLREAEADPRATTPKIDAAKAELAEADAEFKAYRSRGEDKTSVPFTMQPDREAGRVDFEVGGERFSVAAGGWSDFVPVEFVLSDRYSAHGIATFHVLRCDAEEVRVFVPPINIDPLNVPPWAPISAPHDFAADLQHWIGHPYETLGWACITNPLKDWEDTRLPQQSFLDDMVSTEKLREDLLWANLDRADEWDVYAQVLSTVDRVCHMLMRETDPDHPLHDPELAALQVTAWGETFPLSDAVRQVYRAEDRLLGRVLDRMDAGEFGEDCLLLIVSDHGFNSFRREVHVNNVLAEHGWLKFQPRKDGSGERMTLDEVLAARMGRGLAFVDWEASQAYSLGLGEVFINLKGREPQGSVDPADYDRVVEGIRADLLALKDPQNGASAMTSAERRDTLYSGPWWKEGTGTRRVYKEVREVVHDGFGDIILGFAPTYRVSWGTSFGGLAASAFTDNASHWSGDHVSVDPAHVPGVLFGNRRLTEPAVSNLIDIAPTILLRYGIDPTRPELDLDGRPLPLERIDS